MNDKLTISIAIILFLITLLGCGTPQVQPVPQPVPSQPTEVAPPPQVNTETSAIIVATTPKSKIAFVRNYSDYYGWDIFTADSDGTSIERITESCAWDTHPVLSPDGTQIVFESVREWHGLPSIYTMDADGNNVKCLTPEMECCKLPSWSSDGKKIAYCVFKSISGSTGAKASRLFTPDSILVMDADGGNKQRVASGFSPSWLPDGQHIAFLSNQTGIWEVCIASIDGSDSKVYPTCSSPSACGVRFQSEIYPTLAVSPDGKSVAYDNRDYTGKRDVFVMSLTGGVADRLTGNISTNCYSPTWSPDSSKIAFTMEVSRSSTMEDINVNIETVLTDIYMMEANGSNPSLLIKDGMFPSWSTK
jgi:Tol biopolymer transport system component